MKYISIGEAATAYKGLEEGKPEIGYGTSVDRLRMSRDQVDEYTANMYQATKGMIEQHNYLGI